MSITLEEFKKLLPPSYPRLYVRAKVTFKVYFCPFDFETEADWKRFIEKMNNDREHARKTLADNVWSRVDDFGEDGAEQIEDGTAESLELELEYVEKEEDDVDTS